MPDHANITDDTREVAKALQFGSHAVAPASIRAFVEAGQATFTLVNTRTGGRYTYRVAHPERPTQDTRRPAAGTNVVAFVSVLDGPNNERDYTYLGCVYRDGSYRHGAKSRICPDAPSAAGFAWLWRNLDNLAAHPHVEVHHMGTCGRCGRALTVPSSVTTGLGPICAEKAGRGA